MRKKLKIIILFIILATLIINTSPAWGEDESGDHGRVYKLAGDNNHPPYEFIDSIGKYTGFNVDIIQAIAREIGLRIEIIPMEWNDAIESLDNEKIDGIIGMSHSWERRDKYNFTIPSIENEQVIFVNKSIIHVNSLEDLSGYRVAYQKGDYNSFLLEKIPDVIGLAYKDQEASISALMRGEVDAALGNKAVGTYFIQKRKNGKNIKIIGGTQDLTKYGPVVSKSNIYLLNKLNEGMRILLQSEEYVEIQNKWMGEEVQDIFSFYEDNKRTIHISLAMVAGILIFLYAYNKILQKEVYARTAELEKANKDLIVQQDEIYSLAYFDPITDLPNRTYLVEELTSLCDECIGSDRLFALFYLDIDKFKHINDTLGHFVGDKILKLLGERLSKLTGESHLLVRAGGDEFYILVREYKDTEDLVFFANEIINDFKDPYMINEHILHLTASIGVASFPEAGHDLNSIIKNADLALYKSKDLGGNTYYLYGEELESKGLERMQLLNQLRYAIEYDELVLHYQPKIDIKSEKIIGLEALVRWKHPDQGLLYPDKFIGLSEESGLIINMGAHILRRACRDTVSWHKEGYKLGISVNLSSKQFQDKNLVKGIEESLKETGLEAKYLTLEITESTAITDMNHTLEIIRALKEKEISLSIDDFGTGYSSLSYLNDMNANEVKIDRSFIWDIEKNSKNKMISNTIIVLSKELEMKVTAEGVETKDQLDILKDMKCDIAQGYYFYKPLPKDQIDILLKEKY